MSKYFTDRLYSTTVEVNASEQINLACIVAFAAQSTLLHYYTKECPPLKIALAKDEAKQVMFAAGMAKTAVYNRIDAAFKVVSTMKAKCISHPRLEDFRAANDDETKEVAIAGFMADMFIDGMADAVRWAKAGTPLTAAIRAELRTDTKAEKAKEQADVALAKERQKADALAAKIADMEAQATMTAADKLAAMVILEDEARAADEAALASGAAAFDEAQAQGQVVISETETINLTLEHVVDFIASGDEADCMAAIMAANERLAALRDMAKEAIAA